MKTRRKIFYVPGLISLFILPVIFFYYAVKDNHTRIPGFLRLMIADTTNVKNRFRYVGYGKNYLPKRNYIHIRLTGGIDDDNIKLAFSQIRIREILAKNDSINGVHFEFEDSSSYSSFVKAIDILQLEQAKIYWYIDNDIWFFNIPPLKELLPSPPSFICGTGMYTEVVQPKKSQWSLYKDMLVKIWISSSEVIVAFMAFLLAVAAVKIYRKRNQTSSS